MSDPSEPTTRPSVLIRLRDAADADAWRLFLTTYGPLLHGYCRRRGLQDADAADVAQDVLLKVVRALRTFAYDPTRGRFRDWLGTVTRHQVGRFFARRARGDDAVGGDDDERFARLPAEADPEWSGVFNAHLLRTALARVRPHFEEATWLAFSAVWIDQRPAGEVAAELGLPIEQVYVAKSRVVKRLREAVLELAEDVPGLVMLS